MSFLTTLQIAQYAAQAGFTGQNLVTAVAIALAESSGNTDAHCLGCSPKAPTEDSRGLWQINVEPAANPQYANINLYDPLVNAQTAYALSGGTNFSDWTTYTKGVYKSYLNMAQAAVALTAPGNLLSNIGQTVATAVNPGGGQPLAPQTFNNAGGGPLSTVGQAIQASIPGAGDVAKALLDLPNAVTAPFTQAFNNLQAVGTFLSQPNFVNRILLLAGGGILLIVGMVLFALSFVKTSAVHLGT